MTTEHVGELIAELRESGDAPYGGKVKAMRNHANRGLKEVVYNALKEKGPCTARALSYDYNLTPKKVASLLASLRIDGRVEVVEKVNDVSTWRVI